MGPGDEVEFTEGGRRMRGVIESVSHRAREFVLSVRNADKTYRHPRVGFDRCRVPYESLAPLPFGLHQKVRIKDTHPMAGRVGTVTTLSPADAQVDLGDGSMPWVPFEDLEGLAFSPGGKVRHAGGDVGILKERKIWVSTPNDAPAWNVEWEQPQDIATDWAYEHNLTPIEPTPSESPNRSPEPFSIGQTVKLLWSPEGSDIPAGATGRIRGFQPDRPSRFRYEVEMDAAPGEMGTLVYRGHDHLDPTPDPTPDQREALLLAAAEMHEQEHRPKEPRCKKWRAEIVLGLADWESEIPGRGVTFHTTHDGHIEVDAVDTDEQVGTVTFARPHCRESVVVMLNARLKATRLDIAAGIGSQNLPASDGVAEPE